MKISVDRKLIDDAVTFLSYANLYKGMLPEEERVRLIETSQKLDLLLIDNPLPERWAVVKTTSRVTMDIAKGHGLDKYKATLDLKVEGIYDSRDKACERINCLLEQTKAYDCGWAVVKVENDTNIG